VPGSSPGTGSDGGPEKRVVWATSSGVFEKFDSGSECRVAIGTSSGTDLDVGLEC